MKKLIFIIIAFFFVNLSFASDLEIWTSNENIKNALAKLTPQFEQEFKKKVIISVLNKDLTTQFKTAALSGKGPDILCWAHDVVGELAASGIIEPINLDPKLEKKLLPVAVQAYTFQERLYGYPYDLEAVALIYNKDILFDLPNSMEELISISEQFNKKENLHGFLYDFANFFFSFPFLSANGGYIFKNDGKGFDVTNIGLANSGAIKGAEFIQSLASKKIIPTSTDRSIAFNKMTKGHLAATIDGPWAINDLKKAKINYGIAPIPTINGKKPRPFVGTHGFMIRKSSKNKDLAKELIEGYFMTKEGIRKIYEADPRGPSRIDVIEELAIFKPDLKSFMQSAENGIPMPNVPEMGAVWGAAGNALKLIINNQMKPDEAMKKAVQQIESSIQ